MTISPSLYPNDPGRPGKQKYPNLAEIVHTDEKALDVLRIVDTSTKLSVLSNVVDTDLDYASQEGCTSDDTNTLTQRAFFFPVH